MKRKMLSMLMALAMILSLLPVTALAADVNSAEALQNALNAGGDVKLTENVTGNFVVPADKSVTLDLNGKTITNNGDHTITVKYGASLTVTGAGTVDNVTHAKAAIWNEGTVILDGGNYTRSKENGTSAEDAGGNSYYVLVNHGAMTVNSGVSVTQNGHFSSLLENGYYSYASGNASSGYVEGTNAQYPQLTINGGAFTGGLNTIKNDDGGMLTINNGTFSNTAQSAFLNWNVAAVNGGTFNSEGNCILNGGGKPEINQGKLTITGGSFTGKQDAIAAMNGNTDYLDGVTVTGGRFSSDVTAYVPEGYQVVQQGDQWVVSILDDVAVAQIVGGEKYQTLSEAIAAAKDGQTVKLLKDVSINEQVVIGTAITLDLNQHTITNAFVATGEDKNFEYSMITNADATIQNGTYLSTGVGAAKPETRGICAMAGNLTLLDMTARCAGINVSTKADNGTLTITNSTITGDYAVASFANKGTVKITDSEMQGKTCGIYHNGTYYGLNMTVTDSTISGGTGTVGVGDANDNNGVYISGSTKTTENNGGKDHQVSFTNCTVSGGTGIEVKYTDLALDNCTVSTTSNDGPTYAQFNNGSTTSGFSVVATDNSMKPNDPAPGGSVTIKSGYYKGMVGLRGLIHNSTEYPDFKETTYTIFDGYFTTDPSYYLAEGKAALPSDNSAYAFMVGAAAETNVEPAVGAPDVTIGDQIKEEDRETVKTAAESVTTSGELAAAANQAIGQVTEQQKADAEAALKNSSVETEGKTITIYAQTYLDITPTAYNKDKGVLTLNITPMYRVVASTADTAAGIDLEGADKNAVMLEGSEKALTGIQNMTISITLPAGFPTDHLYVKHTKDGAFVGYHKATVDSDANTLTFTNDKGFSTFEIMADDRTATVDFGEGIGRITYTPANVGDTLPTAAAPAGQEFGGWTFAGIEGTYTTLTDDLLTKLAEKSGTITAAPYFYTISSGTSYAITVKDSDNGTVTASRTRANKGLTITLTVKPDEGYKLDDLTVTDKNGNEVKLTDKGDGKYTFAMPASAVTVKASFAKDGGSVGTGLPFTDVKADDWFYEAVKYAYDNKLMDGTSSTTFAPLMTTNRAMIVTILWRLEGSPVVNYAMNFGDVESGVWYTEAVRWAAAEGIVKGYSDTVFAPNDTVTREQLATILYRYAQYKEYDVTAKGDLTTFADGSTVSPWAADGMTWAVGAELITGKNGGKLDPTGTATRAEVATILMRFCENVAK